MSIIQCFATPNLTHCIMHSHSFWEIIYRIVGTTTSVVGNIEYTVSPGDIMIIPPNVPHDDVSPDYYADIDIRIDNLDFLDIPEAVQLHDYSGNVELLIRLMHRTLLEKEYNYFNIANCLFDTLLQYFKKISCSFEPKPIVSAQKDTIYQNLDNPDFLLQKELDHIGYHPDHVRRLFREQTGLSPHSYLLNLRIDKAKQLLTQYPKASIAVVAANCGFQDPNYFSTCFKKKAGCSPLEYRRKSAE